VDPPASAPRLLWAEALAIAGRTGLPVAMRLLVLGGTRFLSKAIAEEGVRRGHDVTCACRGRSGPVPEGARHVVWDRTEPVPTELAEESFDAVVDTARHPSRTRAAVAAFPGAHWVFVSTVNVYSEEAPGGGPATLPVHDPVDDSGSDDDTVAPELYGAMKVACELAVRDGAASSMVVRPGLIVGPGDPTGRYTYWPDRLARATDGDEVLAPGDPAHLVQVIDLRDLADWILDSAEQHRSGVFDGVGPATPLGELLTETARGVGVSPRWLWVDQGFLLDHEVQPWMGERSVPLWLPRPEYDGMMAHDTAEPFDAGLSCRPVADTARDTLTWMRSEPAYERTGLTPAEEAELLAAWHRSADAAPGTA
jgi:2'-hydroxyisoflavone reductase